MKTPEHAITLIRTINTSAEEVYAAWTNPDVMRRWMGRQVDADVRIGGKYRIENGAEGGETYVHKGEYRVLEPGMRIVQTFSAGRTEPDPDAVSPYRDEFLEIRLHPLGPSTTELTLVNGWDGEGMDEEGKAAVGEAWAAWLALLEALFE